MTLENPILRISLLAAGGLMALALGTWLVLSYWPLFLVAGIAGGGYYIYRRSKPNINIAEGVTVTPEALNDYLYKIVHELEWDTTPVINLSGWGETLTVKMRLDFPAEPSNAAEFHSRVIYLQGYIARRLNDDFRIRNVKVEIEADLPSLIREPVYS